MNIRPAFFAAEPASGGIVGALGLDVRTVVLNTLAFLVVVWVLGRFVYPSLTRALDGKRDELNAAARHEAEAKRVLEAAETKAGQVLAEARVAADQLSSDARDAAERDAAGTRSKASAEAERIVRDAKAQLDHDVNAARAELRGEATRLVARATAEVSGIKLDGSADEALVRRSVERTA